MNRHQRRKEQKKQSKSLSFQNLLLNAIDLHSKKQFKDAEKIYMELNVSDPHNYDLQRHLGILYQDQGEYEKAYNFYLKALDIRPNGFEAISNLGAVHIINKNTKLAIKCFEKALSINPKYTPAINNLSGLHHRLGDSKLSLKYAKLALSLQPNNILTKNQFAKSLILNRKLDEAIKIFKTLVKENPNHDDFKFNLATALRENGEITEANKIIKSIFEADFKKIEYLGHYASNKDNNLSPEQIEYYESLLNEESTRVEEKITIATAFFEFYRNQDNYKLSGKYLKRFTDIHYKEMDFDIEQEENFFNSIKDMFQNLSFNPEDKKLKTKPVFICGMPRSGTSLCEQILSTHSKVIGAGELSLLTDLTKIEKLIQTPSDKIKSFRENINDKEFLQNVRDKYLSFISEYSDGKIEYVTDKLPHNFIFIGLIKLIFPEAKIIYCKRDPMDNCYSLYTHKFVDMSHHYSYDQVMLGKYYLLHKEFMGFWLDKYKDIFVLDNEELVNNQEIISKALIKHCGLKWEKECLNFHNTKRQVRTASIEQVRQPINKKSIGAWKKYEPYLSELISTLGNQNNND
tara:strand:- start:1002 stop:2720 length:1719 start_codon:yes stop_codon:yes gene_type:complete